MTPARPHGPRRTGARAFTVAVLLLGAALLGAGPAAAAGAVPPAGDPLGVTPASGNLDVVPTLTTGGPCPAGTTHAYAVLYGGALPDDGQVLRDTARHGLSTGEAFSSEASRTWRDVFAAAGAAPSPARHLVELVCTDELGRKLARSTVGVAFTATGFDAEPGPQPTEATLAAGAPPADPTDLAALDPQALADLLEAGGGGQPGDPGAAPDPAAPPAGAGAPGSGGSGEQTPGQTGTPSAAEGTAGSPGPGSLLAVGLLGGALTAAALLGVPALRRRRATTDPHLDDRELAPAGRTAP